MGIQQRTAEARQAELGKTGISLTSEISRLMHPAPLLPMWKASAAGCLPGS